MTSFFNYFILHFFIIFSWIVLFTLFIGLGSFMLRVLKRRVQNYSHIFISFWVGFGSLILFLQVIHLFLPINLTVFTAFTIIGLIGLLMNFKEFKILLIKVKNTKGSPILFLLIILALFLVANRSLGSIQLYDTGLYHIQNLLWNESNPIVAGLGNVHGRFGFNSSYFLIVSLQNTLGSLVGFSQGFRISSGLIVMAYGLGIILSYLKLVRSKGDLGDKFTLLTLPIWLYIVFNNINYLSSFSPDLPVILLSFTITSLFLNLLEKRGEGDHLYLFLLITFLVTITITLKLSFAPYGAAIFLASLIYYLRSHSFKTLLKPVAATLVLLSFGTIAVWMLRGIIISGYPLYPSTFLAFDVPWRVALSTAIDEANWIQSWAKQPSVHWGTVLNNKHLKFGIVPISYYPRSIAEGKKMHAIKDGTKALIEILKFNIYNK